MKICVIRHAPYPQDRRVHKEVQALLGDGYKVDTICMKNNHSDAYHEIIDKVKVYRIPLIHKRGSVFRYFFEYGISFLLMSILLFFLFIKNRYDFIQINTMPDFLVFSAAIPKFFGAKIILDLHEPTPELWITKYGKNRYPILLEFQTKIEQLAIKFADLPLTVTKTLKKRYEERGATLNKITVVPNVCDDEIFKYNGSQRSVKKDKFVIFTHGTMEERYGHETMIRAVNSLRGKINNFQFNITGKGSYEPELAKLIEELGCGDIVKILGLLPFNKFLDKLKEADIGINAMYRNPYSELIDTNKMYEYMALKIPVVTSRLAAIEENFDNSCLMYFEPGNYHDLAKCILELYSNTGKREELVANAFKRFQMMKWSNSKHDYLAAIRKICK